MQCNREEHKVVWSPQKTEAIRVTNTQPIHTLMHVVNEGGPPTYLQFSHNRMTHVACLYPARTFVWLLNDAFRSGP